ncbi:MAG: DUF1553 domain-containing protein [Acidobacteria bacterium]|nr:DUF1553 domain-containing protein [Acidobacteriota bacterium]
MRKALGLALAAWCAQAAPKLSVLPGASTLSTPESRQQLLAQSSEGGREADWTRQARWSSSNEAVARVDASGLVSPVGDGEAVITAAANGATATARVKVHDAKAAFAWSFRNHVIPVMTKMGCNQGACHGALAGKNGFKLTLRGYDPEVDYDTLTRGSLGRRVSLADPSASLLLRKAIFEIPHGGGKRFAANSLEYRVISEWIAEGAPAPAAADADVTGLEVFPSAAVLAPGAEQQLVVRARYSDGRVEDVTRWVKFSSNDEGVAGVDDSGRVKMNGHGEAAITLWYSNKVLYSRLTVPFAHQVEASRYEKFPRRNFVDELVVAKLKSLNIAPSGLANDGTFIRRAYLDAAGILPTAEEVENFLADTRPDKRARMIDALLERDEYVDYWAYKWSELMLVSTRKLRGNTMWAFYNWIRDGVKANKPWNRFASEIFTGSGSTRENGALNYFVMHKDPIDLTENTVQAFLGQRLTCARCHNHPMEKWTQKQYYQMANLFSRVGMKNGENGEAVVYAKNSGNINHPRLLRPLPPTPLDGAAMDLNSGEDRRAHFARWLTDPSNSYFSRSVVNRVWGNFMGRGLVHPLDDVRATNPASNEDLFAAVTKDFVDHGFDIKHLIRTIMNSAAYQLASDANETNQNDNKYYSRYIIKRLPAEVILDAMSQVTGVPTAFPGMPAGTRAMQLPDSQIASQFLNVFGRPPRVICDVSERSSDPSIAQALHVINGETLNRKLGAADGYVSLFLKLGLPEKRILDHVYLSAFSRYPTDGERQEMSKMLQEARPAGGTTESRKEARRQGLEDLLWAMLTSKEFLFNN